LCVGLFSIRDCSLPFFSFFSISGNCMEGLMHLLYCTSKDKVIDEAVVTLRQLFQQNVDHSNASIDAITNLIHRLVKMLISDDDTAHVLTMPVARASVVWVVGESYTYLEDISPDILRILAAKFSDEATQTKTQIANFAIKLGARLPDNVNIQGLMTYVLEMARYDVDIDLRDRSRFMTAMMGLTALSDEQDEENGSSESKQTIMAQKTSALTELSSHALSVLLAPKLPPVTTRRTTVLEDTPDFEIGSLSALVGHSAGGYVPIPNWSDTQVEPNAREPISSKSLSTRELSGTSDNYKDDTDNFYGDSENNGGGIFFRKSEAVKDRVLSDSDSSRDSDSSSSTGSSSEDSDSDDGNSDSDGGSGSESDSSGDEESDSDTTSSDEDDMYMTTKTKTEKAHTATTLASVRRVAKTSPAPITATESCTLDTSNLVTESLIPMLQESPRSKGVTDTNLVGFSSQEEITSTALSTHFAMGSSDMDFLNGRGSSQPQLQPPPSDNSESAILAQMFESFPARSQDNNNLTDIVNTSHSPSPQSTPTGNSLPEAMSALKMSSSSQIGTVTSVPKVLLRSALSSGLQATFRFRHGVTATQIPGAHSVYIELKNCNSEGSLRYELLFMMKKFCFHC
jgi:hypothetical protein